MSEHREPGSGPPTATSQAPSAVRRAGVDPQELVRLYAAGENVMSFLRNRGGEVANDPFSILAAYDLQAGSYVRALEEDAAFAAIQRACCAKFADLFDRLAPDSLLEAGVGEATTLANVLAAMKTPPSQALGFDISVSRALVGRSYLATRGTSASLFTGALESIPLEANSVDVVYTSHSIEPNGGREREILQELYRVARRYLVLREPSNELGSAATGARMREHGYARDLHATALGLGYDVVEHSAWRLDPNPANEAALIVIRKPNASTDRTSVSLASPVSKTALVACGGALYSAQDRLIFPVLAGIPCLLPENGVFCIRWQEHVPPV